MNLRNLFLFASGFLALQSYSQLSGIFSVPGTYTSVAAAVSDLNLLGVSGAVTVNISAGYSETVPLGGLTLTATGTALNPITFQKSGAGLNPLLLAYAGGTATPASAVQDGIWSLIGCDYVTIAGIDLADQNTTNPSTMEYGYGLFKSSATNGCQNVTIRNCTVTLNRVNNAVGAGVSFDGSRAINVVNALITSHTNSILVTSLAGANSNNRFYSNLLQNCNIGVALAGYDDVSPFNNADYGNQVGGATTPTGNNILNFGGGGINPSMAVKTLAQQSVSVSYNTINNNNGSGVNHLGVLKGIMIDLAPEANVMINNNSLTLKFGGTGSTVTCIENLAGSGGSTNTIQVTSNLITQCTNINATAGPWYGIYNNASSPRILNISNNSFTGNSTAAPGSSVYLVSNTGSVSGLSQMTSNNLTFSYNGSFGNTGNFYGIFNAQGAITSTVNISQNTFSGTMFPTGGTGNVNFVLNYGSCDMLNILSNVFNGLNVNNNGFQSLIFCAGFVQSQYNISGNSIINNYIRSGNSGSFRLIECANSTGPNCKGIISSNNFTGINNTGTTTGNFKGISCASNCIQVGVYPHKTISNNVISSVTYSTSSLVTHFGYVFNALGDGNSGLPSVISNNTFSGFTTAGNVIGFWLLSLTGPTVATIVSNNTIAAVTTNTGNGTGLTQYIRGMYVDGGPGGMLIDASRIYSLTAKGDQSEVHGILIAGLTTMTISNSIIGNLYTPAGYGYAINGIKSTASTGTLNLFHNSIHLNASSAASNFRATNLVTSSFEHLRMKNNIFVNNSTPSGSGGQVAVSREWGSMSSYDAGNNNNIFYAGTCSNCDLMESGAVSYNTIAALKTALYPMESNSHRENVPFASVAGSNPLFLHINVNTFSQANNNGLAIPNYSLDIDNDIRQGYPGYLGNGIAPDIGADEYDSNVAPCGSALTPFISPGTTTFCPGTPFTMVSNVSNPGNGRTFDWKIGSAAAGPFTSAINGAGTTNTTYIGPALPPGIYYMVLTNTCALGSGTAASNTASFQVITGPQYTLSATANSLCAGQSVTLSAIGSGATSFTWRGPELFSSNVQNAVIGSAGPGHSGTYTLRASSNFCTFEGTVILNVYPAVTAVSVSPQTATICNGSTALLTAAGGSITTNHTIGTATNTYSYPVNLSPYTRVYAGQKRQMIVLASELIAAGITPNSNISSIQFPVNSLGQYWLLPNYLSTSDQAFSVRIGNTSLNSFSLNTPFQSGLSTVYGPTNYRPKPGYDNYHQFTTPFFWNGTTNIIIETSFSNGAYLNYSEQAAVYQYYHNTADTMNIVYQADNQTAAVIASASNPNLRYRARPNFKLNTLSPGAYTWTPAATLSSPFGISVIATPPSSTNYTVSVSDNTCSASSQSQLQVQQNPIVTASAVPSVVCIGQSVLLSANGANSLQWTNGPAQSNYVISPQNSAVYSVVGTNAPCAPVIATVQVVVNPLPLISVQISTTSICTGQSATLTALGNGSFQWNTLANTPVISVSPTTATTYSVTLTDINQCQKSANVYLTVYPLPLITLNPNSATICQGEEFTFTAGGALQYSWTAPGGTGNTLTLPTAQQFTLTGTSSQGCQNNITGALIVDLCTSLQAEVSDIITGVYPNPSAGQFIISAPLTAKTKVMRVHDLSGKVLFERELVQAETRIDLGNCANGLYFVELLDEARVIATRKIIKQ